MNPSMLSASLTWRRFAISLAASPEEVEETQRLRHEVFCREWRGCDQGGLDQDEFDATCDHLMVRDLASGLLIATYRFNRASRTDRFYSEHEFTIAPFLAQAVGEKAECGRACIRKEWRNNQAMIALGRGITWFVLTRGARWLFGCSSVNTTHPRDAALLQHWLVSQGHALAIPGVGATPDFRLPGLDAVLGPFSQAESTARAEALLPPLLRFYLRAGAKIALDPAYDREFACIDFFTVVDMQAADPGFTARYA